MGFPRTLPATTRLLAGKWRTRKWRKGSRWYISVANIAKSRDIPERAICNAAAGNCPLFLRLLISRRGKTFCRIREQFVLRKYFHRSELPEGRGDSVESPISFSGPCTSRNA